MDFSAKENRRKYDSIYYKKNKKRIKKLRKKYRKDNRKKIRKQHKKYIKSRKLFFRNYYRKYSKMFRKKHKKRILRNERNSNLRTNYGITIDDYDILLKKQKYVCGICKKKELVKDQNGKVKSLCVDHDHKTNKIRGLLCSRCNRGLGLLRDSVKILNSALKYLKGN